MDRSRRRRSIRNRITTWTAGAILLLAWYPLGAPFVAFACAWRFQAALPVLEVAYRPLGEFMSSDLPGSDLYRAYVGWCFDFLNAAVDSKVIADREDVQTQQPGDDLAKRFFK
jgi:hypothetical protein